MTTCPHSFSQTCPPNTDKSVYFNEINGVFDAIYQEADQDAGGMMHTGVLSDLLNGFSLSSWVNPVAYDDIDISGFAWDGNLTEGCTQYIDQFSNPPEQVITYDYRRYTMQGDSGVIFFPDGFLDNPPACSVPPHRKVDIFIGCRSTKGQLHAPYYFEDIKDPSTNTCPTDLDVGPNLTIMGTMSLKRSRAYTQNQADNHVIFALPAGGGGPHPAWQMIQSVLAIRKKLHDLAQDANYCFEVGDVYLLGSSFGTAVALNMLQVYPDLFDGACCWGAHGLATQSFFGYQRYLKFGMQMTHLPIFNGANSDTFLVDDFYYHQVQELLAQAPNAVSLPGITPSDGMDNLSFLSRLQWRAANASLPLPGRPVIFLASDEDNVTMAHLFRYELEDQVANISLNGGKDYSDYFKILPIAFKGHTDDDGGGFTVSLNPSQYFPSLTPPSSGNLVDWLVQLKADMVADGNFATLTQASLDEGVPEPNAPDEYRLHEATIDSPRDASVNYGTFTLENLWEANGGQGFVGTGVEPGLQHNLIVEDLDDDGALEIVYGDADGFVHVYEWLEAGGNSQFVFQWRSPDFGSVVSSISAGYFSDTGTAKGLLVATHSGELWTIKLAGGFQAYEVFQSHLKWAGERENPSVEIGPLSEGITPVYIVGTGTAASGASTDSPNVCRITRLDFSQIDQSATPGPTFRYAEKCEPVTDLVWDDVEGELLATNMRGYLMRIQDLGSPSFFQFAQVTNYGLGEYLDVAACQVRKVMAGSSPIYIVAGVPGDPNKPNNPLGDANLVAVDACGEILGSGTAKQLVPAAVGGKEYMGINAFDILSQDSSTIRLVIGSANDGIQFWDYSIAGASFSKVATLPEWSVQHFFDGTLVNQIPSTILSLRYVEINSETGRLFGTTDKGIVFAFDLPPGSSSLPSEPAIIAQLEPFWGAYGLKAIDEKLPTSGAACGTQVDRTLNVVPHYSYHHPYAQTVTLPTGALAGSAYYKLDAQTGAVLCQRPREEFARAFNPERRLPSVTNDGLTWDVFWIAPPLGDILQDKHVFVETVDIGSLEVAGRMDLAYTPPGLQGQLRARPDYLNGVSTLTEPTGGTFMLSDRFYTSRTKVDYFGNAVRIGNILENGDGIQEIVMTTAGGRLVTAKMDSGALAYEVSWDQIEPSLPTGDYGTKLTGLALYDIDGDGYDEIFATGATYSDPIPATSPENNSRLLIWDRSSANTDLQLGNPTQIIDLGEPGCMGLWIGRGLGRCPCLPTVDMIIGKSQTFDVYKIQGQSLPITLKLKHESAGLGSHLGAFNSIEVLHDQDEDQNGKVVDWIFIGSNAYVYGFRTNRYYNHLGM